MSDSPPHSPESDAIRNDCTSVGFSGEGRCVNRAVVDRMDDNGGMHPVCFEHFTRRAFLHFRPGLEDSSGAR